MRTKELLEIKMREKGIDRKELLVLLGCDEKTLRLYLKGITVSGKYVLPLLHVLDISVDEWNECINVKEKYA